MTKSIRMIAVVAFAVAIVVAWANASIRKDAASQMSGPTLTDAQVDMPEYTKSAGGLLLQEVVAY